MIFGQTKLKDAWILDPAMIKDDRGFFARAWCRKELEERGLAADFVQANLSQSFRRGTIRGLHYQLAPYQEAKLVRCIRGSIWDVAVDLRTDSPSYLQWFGVELTAENRRQLYVPPGCAHGYQSLVDEAEVIYQTSQFYTPDVERGIRWDDTRFSIDWPEPKTVTLSPKDRAWPDFQIVDESPASRRREPRS